MKKYRVLRKTHGFQGRMWYQDDIVEFDDDVKPPHHFELLSGKAEVLSAKEKIEEEKTALSQLQRKQVKPLPTAGTVMKKQKYVGEKQPEDF